MTEREAIKRFKESNEFMKDEINDVTIKALEKQIPKKPDTECDDWICPNCKEEYDIYFDKYDYCPRCGQAIDKSYMDSEEDWSEEE